MNPTASLHLSAAVLRLSDTLDATLVIEGPPPLILSLPQPLLAPASASAWKLTTVGTPKVEKLIDGLERWSQQYRLVPFAVGDVVPVEFAPIGVGAGASVVAVEVPPQKVAVKSSAEASSQFRPPAPWERLPEEPAAQSSWPLFASIFIALLILALAARRGVKKTRPPLPPLLVAIQGVARLDLQSPTFFADYTGLIRGYVQAETGSPWTTLTAREAAATGADAVLAEMLLAAEAQQFAGATPDAEWFDACLALERELQSRLPNPPQNLTSTTASRTRITNHESNE